MFAMVYSWNRQICGGKTQLLWLAVRKQPKLKPSFIPDRPNLEQGLVWVISFRDIERFLLLLSKLERFSNMYDSNKHEVSHLGTICYGIYKDRDRPLIKSVIYQISWLLSLSRACFCWICYFVKKMTFRSYSLRLRDILKSSKSK